MRRARTVFFTAAGALAAAATAVAATYVLPVSVALGPCMKDWTSPSSYLPRASKLGHTPFPIGEGSAKVCYGRPSARGRIVFGALVPYGALWRLGANEPTRLFTSEHLTVAGIDVAPGRYSLYAVPDTSSWQLFISRSTFHWGNAITADVRSREIGSATIPVERSDEFVETLTVDAATRAPDSVTLILAWERTRVPVPIAVARP